MRGGCERGRIFPRRFRPSSGRRPEGLHSRSHREGTGHVTRVRVPWCLFPISAKGACVLSHTRSSMAAKTRVAAGLLGSLTSYPIFEPLIAAGLCVWFIASTVREVFASSEELIWPEKIVCGHSDHEGAGIGAAPSQP